MLYLDTGPFPGTDVDDKVFIEKAGTVEVMNKGGILNIMDGNAAVGSWSTESVTGKDVSYY
eukprot:12113346-Ditylum_brightwellii.AAC.1